MRKTHQTNQLYISYKCKSFWLPLKPDHNTVNPDFQEFLTFHQLLLHWLKPLLPYGTDRNAVFPHQIQHDQGISRLATWCLQKIDPGEEELTNVRKQWVKLSMCWVIDSTMIFKPSRSFLFSFPQPQTVRNAWREERRKITNSFTPPVQVTAVVAWDACCRRLQLCLCSHTQMFPFGRRRLAAIRSSHERRGSCEMQLL